MAAASLVIIVVWPRVTQRIPAPFVALIVTTVVVQLLHLPVETIGTRFGELNAAIPHPQLPHLTLAQLTGLVGPAFTIAMLAAIESLLSAVVADGMIGGRHRSNMELVAQGVANIASPLVRRNSGDRRDCAHGDERQERRPHARRRNHARRHAAAHHALLRPVGGTDPAGDARGDPRRRGVSHERVAHVPGRACVRQRAMSPCCSRRSASPCSSTSRSRSRSAWCSPRSSSSAAWRRSPTSASSRAASSDDLSLDPAEPWRTAIPRGVSVFEINGPFFFGAVETFQDTLDHLAERPRVLIIRMRDVHALDSTGMHALKDVVQRSRRAGTEVLLADVQPQPRSALEASGALAEIGATNVCPGDRRCTGADIRARFGGRISETPDRLSASARRPGD